MSNIFVRGGQLSIHSLRMFNQLFLVLVKCFSVLMICMNMVYYLWKINLYQAKVMYWYLTAQICVDLGSKEHVLKIQGIQGNYITMSAFKIINDSNIIIIKDRVIDILWEGFILTGYICVIFFFIVTIIFLKKGKSFNQTENIRGSKLILAKHLKKLINKDNKSNETEGYYLANVPYPSNSESTHTMIAGSTGSGKTILISDLIVQIKKRGDRAIIYDKMGVYTERFYDANSDILLNPFDKRSPNWSLFKEVGHEASFDSIASALIPLDKSSADPFWIKAARTLFSEVCSSLLKKGNVTNEELVNTLLKKDLAEAAKLIRGTAAQAIIDEQSPKTALSVMAILSTYLKCLKFLKNDGEVFSIRDWIKNEEGKGCIFISSTGDFHTTLMPLISAWLEIAINNILSLNSNHKRKIWIILDELPSLHNLPSLEQGLAETRQFGGCFILSIQSISQLRDRYGINGSQTLSSLCNNKVFLRAGDYDSAKWYADNIGVSETEEFRENLSYGAHETRDGVNINKHKQNKNLVLASELANLKDKEGYFCMAKGYPIAKVHFNHVEWPKLNLKFEAIENDSNYTNASEVLLDKDHSKVPTPIKFYDD